MTVGVTISINIKTMRHLIVRMLCIGLLAAGSVLNVSAQEKKVEKTNSVQSLKELRRAPFQGTVASVDKTAKVITLEGEKHQVIHISAQTKITKDGQPATLDNVTAGTKVTGSKRETAPEKWEAGSLIIHAPKATTNNPAVKK
jgi:hypothetical protein